MILDDVEIFVTVRQMLEVKQELQKMREQLLGPGEILTLDPLFFSYTKNGVTVKASNKQADEPEISFRFNNYIPAKAEVEEITQRGRIFFKAWKAALQC